MAYYFLYFQVNSDILKKNNNHKPRIGIEQSSGLL